MTIPVQTKDPDEVLAIAVDWDTPPSELNGETISSVTWVVPAGITLDSQSETDTVATGVFSGGTAGTSYSVVCRIVTSGGQTLEQPFTIAVDDSTTAAAAPSDQDRIDGINAAIDANPDNVTEYELPDGRRVRRGSLSELIKAQGILEARKHRQSGAGIFVGARPQRPS